MKFLITKNNSEATQSQDQLEQIHSDIDRYWGDETEIMFPISVGQIKRLSERNTKKEVVYSISNLKRIKKVNARWLAYNPNVAYSDSPNSLHIILSKSTLAWLLEDESPLVTICGRIAKSTKGAYYIHFEKYELTLVDGGIGGGDGGGIGLKIPKGA